MIEILTVRKPLNIFSPQFVPVEDENSRGNHFQSLWQIVGGDLHAKLQLRLVSACCYRTTLCFWEWRLCTG